MALIVWIMDYIKTHTVKGAYKMQRNTAKELYFVNCRIKLLNEDGIQYGVYDWTRDLQKNLRKNLGLKCTNKAHCKRKHKKHCIDSCVKKLLS